MEKENVGFPWDSHGIPMGMGIKLLNSMGMGWEWEWRGWECLLNMGIPPSLTYTWFCFFHMFINYASERVFSTAGKTVGKTPHHTVT